MTQSNVTLYKWKCDALRCDVETEEGTQYSPPKGWASFTIHDPDYPKQKHLHFCPSCVIDLQEVQPVK